MYYARGSVGIQKLMREMQIATEKKPPVPPKARPATAEPKSTAVMPLSKKQHAMPSAAASSSSSSGLLRPTEVPGKSSGAAPIEPKQPPTPKKMPTTAIKSPPAAKAIAKSEASPPGRDGQFWIAGTDLPPLASDHRYLNAQKCEKLGRKISFILRGFTNKPEFGTRTPNIDWAPDDLSADWNEFYRRLESDLDRTQDVEYLRGVQNTPRMARLAMKFLSSATTIRNSTSSGRGLSMATGADL